MTRVVIVEDEPMAAAHLERMVSQIIPDVDIVGRLDSVKGSVQWFKTNQPPDLVFMDIQLADGKSFQIFEQCAVSAPVIFTTAYNEYALKAFKVNSIDYILKPVDATELKGAIDKFRTLQIKRPAENPTLFEELSKAMQLLSKKYKERFVLKVGEHLRSIETAEILFFYSEDKATFAQGSDNRKHILDNTLDQLEGLLDPAKFFRISRKYIVSIQAIGDMISYTNSRLKLKLKGSGDDDIIVARERVGEFKEWLDR